MGFLPSLSHAPPQRTPPPPNPLPHWELTPGDKNLNLIMHEGIQGNGYEDPKKDTVERVLKFRRAIFRDKNISQGQLQEIFQYVKSRAKQEGALNEYNRWKNVSDHSAGRKHKKALLDNNEPDHHSNTDLGLSLCEYLADFYQARDPGVKCEHQAADAPLRHRSKNEEILKFYDTPISPTSASPISSCSGGGGSHSDVHKGDRIYKQILRLMGLDNPTCPPGEDAFRQLQAPAAPPNRSVAPPAPGCLQRARRLREEELVGELAVVGSSSGGQQERQGRNVMGRGQR